MHEKTVGIEAQYCPVVCVVEAEARSVLEIWEYTLLGSVPVAKMTQTRSVTKPQPLPYLVASLNSTHMANVSTAHS